METKVCQCCAMPMATDEFYGTNADGSKNDEYCKYCYVDGEVQFKGTMDEMIDICVPHMVQGNPGMTEETARKMMAEILPTLKFWRQKTA
ncbi:MAG: zinc ribbon domain-containing protein [Clostridiales bacterium]|nr:zinc ribbon domain-containing protein [Clostridiales bacterium]